MTATAPTVSGMTLFELVNRMLRNIGLPQLGSVSELAFTGSSIQTQAEQFIYDHAKDYFQRWVEGGIAHNVSYSITGTTLNVRTLAATSPALTFNMAVAVRGAGDYEGRNFSLAGDGLVHENGKPKTFGTETVVLDIATGPIFNTSAADDTTAYRAWFEAINPALKTSMATEIIQKWRIYKNPDATMDAFNERERQRGNLGVEKAGENRADAIQAPPTFQPMSASSGRGQ